MEIKLIGKESVQYVLTCSELQEKFHIVAEDIKNNKKNAAEFVQNLVKRAKMLLDSQNDTDPEEETLLSVESSYLPPDKIKITIKREREVRYPEELELDISDDEFDEKETLLKQTLGFNFHSFHTLVAGCNQLGDLEMVSHLVKNQNDYLLMVHSDDEAAIGAVAIILSEFADENFIIQDAEERMKRADILIKGTAIEQLKSIFKI